MNDFFLKPFYSRNILIGFFHMLYPITANYANKMNEKKHKKIFFYSSKKNLELMKISKQFIELKKNQTKVII